MERELPARESRVAAHRREVRAGLADLRRHLLALGAWGDPGVDSAMAGSLGVVDALDRLAAAGEPLPGDAHELRVFLARLPEAVRAWRGAW